MIGALAPGRVRIDTTLLQEICQGHQVARLSVFGSVLRDDFRPDSDIDVLVEFEPGRSPGYFGLGHLALELDKIFGRDVDLQTPLSLSPLFREEVLNAAVPLYATD